MWHGRADGSRPVWSGADGQQLLIDLPTQTVLAQTAVDQSPKAEAELHALFRAAVEAV